METFQARVRTTSPSVSSFVCFLVFIIAVAGAKKPILVNASRPPAYLVVYNHRNSVPPNNTAVVSVSTNGDYTGRNLSFGSIFVVANVLREGRDADSTVLGQLDGQLTAGRDSLYVSETLVFDTSRYSGSITTQGTIDRSGNGELAITGGSGDFRYARGYIVTGAASLSDPQDIVFELALHIKYE